MDRLTIEEQVDNFVKDYLDKNFKFREYQKEYIVDILMNILNEDGHKCHTLQAPTGSGKSLIAIIAAGVLDKYYGMRSYILASDLSLWDQYAKYIEDHPKLNYGVLKGMSNYKCNETGESITTAPCTLAGVAPYMITSPYSSASHGFSCASVCKYIKNRKKALTANVTLLTYQLYLHCVGHNATDPQLPVFDNRDVVFCDECHNLPTLMQLRYQFTFERKDVENLTGIYEYMNTIQCSLFSDEDDMEVEVKKLRDKYPTKQSVIDRFNQLYERLINYRTTKDEDLEDTINMMMLFEEFEPVKNLIKEQLSQRRKNHEFISNYDKQAIVWGNNIQRYVSGSSIKTFIDIIRVVGTQYLVKAITEIGNDRICQIQCAKEDYMVYLGILSNTPKQVLLSATVPDQDDFEEQIGISYCDQKEMLMDRIPSTFDFSQSPIYFLNRYKMSFKDRDESLKSLLPILIRLLSTDYKDVKGMIQTGSYKLAKDIIDAVPESLRTRLLYYNGNNQKNEVILQHQMSQNSILIGPTLNEGLDLPGDDCRFIIIMKVPYPTIKDRLTVAKLDLFPKWYNSTTAQTIIQGIGRGNRFKEDWCKTYILDACFSKLYLDTNSMFPKEIKDRIRFIK